MRNPPHILLFDSIQKILPPEKPGLQQNKKTGGEDNACRRVKF